jgi:hypothetical protein
MRFVETPDDGRAPVTKARLRKELLVSMAVGALLAIGAPTAVLGAGTKPKIESISVSDITKPVLSCRHVSTPREAPHSTRSTWSTRSARAKASATCSGGRPEWAAGPSRPATRPSPSVHSWICRPAASTSTTSKRPTRPAGRTPAKCPANRRTNSLRSTATDFPNPTTAKLPNAATVDGVPRVGHQRGQSCPR